MGKNMKKIAAIVIIFMTVVSAITSCSQNEDAEFGISDTGHRVAWNWYYRHRGQSRILREKCWLYFFKSNDYERWKYKVIITGKGGFAEVSANPPFL